MWLRSLLWLLMLSVFSKRTKSVINELITFLLLFALRLLAYAATTNTISLSVIGLWASIPFSSVVPFSQLNCGNKTSSLIPAVVYHAILPLIIFALYWLGLLSLVALAFGVALLEFGIT